MDHTAARTSICLSAAAALLRGLRLPGRVRLLDRLGRLCGPALIRARLHPYTFHFETGDIFQALMALDRYEPETSLLLRRILRPGDIYVDVGAQLGYTAAQAARRVGPGGRIILFEPDPRAFARLKRHIATGRPSQAPRATLRRLACSDRAGTGRLHLAGMIGNSSLEKIRNGEPKVGSTRVKLDSLDAQLSALKIKGARLLKIDVEGHELWALRGARRLLERRRIDYLLVEKKMGNLWSVALEPTHLHALLTGLGYLGAHEDGRPITRQSLGETECENLLYAGSADLLQAVFPRLDPAAIGLDYAPGELAQCFAEVSAPDHPAVMALQIIRLAERGRIPEAIRRAADLLAVHPELTHLRGHYAYWIWMQGRITESLEELRRVEAEQPDNAHVREMIVKLSGGNPV